MRLSLPPVTHFIAADGHFVGAPGEAERFASLLALARDRGACEVSLLGDLFELWLGLRGLESPWQRRVLAPLEQLKGDGVKLRYVVGNKDYFIDAWNERHRLFDEVVAGSCIVSSPQGPLLLAHGDLVNRADRQYRLWCALSRSRVFSWGVRALPRTSLAHLATRVAEGMKKTNRYHKSYFPELQLRARAQEQPRGALTLVFGHFHVHQELAEGDKRIITLPFLGAENAGLLVCDDGFVRLAA